LPDPSATFAFDPYPPGCCAAAGFGAFAGLRVSEAVALRVEDVDFTRGIVHPKVQWSQGQGGSVH
jgi:integrase